MARLRIFTLIWLFLAVAIYQYKHPDSSTIDERANDPVPQNWMKNTGVPTVSSKDIRPADQTFLTFPEWFLVFSPDEQADYFKGTTSTSFPYMGHVSQLWNGYKIVYSQIKDNYQFNTGYHVMIWVIAVSTTVEYGLKSVYETMVGGFTDTGQPLTSEDQFNANYMRSYVDFIETTPWYLFDFMDQLHGLWSETSAGGGHWLRKLERRYYLTTELLVKAGYGYLIKLGTQSAYEEALLNTTVILDTPFDKGHYPDGVSFLGIQNGIMMSFPRYAPFKIAAAVAGQQDLNFNEIAGNDSAILLTVISSQKPNTDPHHTKVLFSQPFLTKPGLNRFALVTTVPQLSKVLSELRSNNIEVEHIYDY